MRESITYVGLDVHRASIVIALSWMEEERAIDF
jgi:hypothetical protein